MNDEKKVVTEKNWSHLDINTERLLVEIDKIEKIKTTLIELNKQVNNRTDMLKDYWISHTSETVFSSFPSFYKALEKVCDELNGDIEFLRSRVKQGYEVNNENTNKKIDEEIAIE